MRDAVLSAVARIGGLVRRSDGWNSSLHVQSWRGNPPDRPVIAYEWIEPGTERARVVRRERWVDGPDVTYGTTIGNAWLFGHADEVLPIGHVLIRAAEHRIRLPKPDRSAERRAKRQREASFTVPFNVEGRLAERLEGMFYPDGGADLEP